MNEFDIDQALKQKSRTKRDVPEFFSAGVDEILAHLPEQNQQAKRGSYVSVKWTWLHTTAAASIIAVCMLISSFASPAMAAVLMKIPGLQFIYSATYTDISNQPEDPDILWGSTVHFGDKGPFNLEVTDVRMFDSYSEVKHYIGMDIPQLPGQQGSIRINNYNEKGYEIYAFNEEGILLIVVPHAVNLPQFEGHSVNPEIKSTAMLNGLEADVLSYQFSKTKPEDRTSYVTWQRNGFTLILAGAKYPEPLIELARDIDRQALELHAVDK